MPIDILLGLQWGDEGKGKIVDVLTPQYDIVARFQGGANAGHTIIFGGQKFVLHLIPSGIFHEGVMNVIGNGVVIDPVALRDELRTLEATGQPIRSRLLISQRAHLILPTHKLLDEASERAKGEQKIGSTLRGIGPAYMDKTGRNGLRVGDILLPDFESRYRILVEKHASLLRDYYGFEYDLTGPEQAFFEAIETLRSLQLVHTEHILNQALREGKRIMAEGAQGALLDVDFGSYPFVTSSHTTAAGACSGLGISPRHIGRVFGVFKAYCTRVGSGPFPTELHGEAGERIRKAGREFGATTGRPRRCGWIDLPLLRYAITLNGVTDLVMTKADVLSGFGEVRLCAHYEREGEDIFDAPYDLYGINPHYTGMPGWQLEAGNYNTPGDLPDSLRAYVQALEKFLEVPLTWLSTGPDREHILKLH